MSEETGRGTRFVLIRSGTVVLILAAIVAWCSNPTQDDFNRWFARQLYNSGSATDSVLDKLASKAAPHLLLATMDCEHTNYGFFSIVKTRGPVNAVFIGALGQWWPIGDGEHS